MRASGIALCLASFSFLVLNSGRKPQKEQPTVYRLDSMEGLEAVNTKAEVVTYRGRKALHLTPVRKVENAQGSMVALVTGTDLKDGTIEVEVAGLPIAA